MAGLREGDFDRILALADDPDQSVRQAIAYQIVFSANRDLSGKAGDAILKLLREDDAKFRKAVIRSLWGATLSSGMEERIIELSRSENSGESYDALYYALSTQANKSEASVKRLIEFLSHQDTLNVAGRAAWGLGQGVAEEQRGLVADACLKIMRARKQGSYLFNQSLNRVEQYAGDAQREAIDALLAKPGVIEDLRKRLQKIIGRIDSQGIAQAAEPRPSEEIIIVVTGEGCEVGGEECSEENLTIYLKDAAAKNRNQAVILRAPENTPYGKLVEILDLVKKAGIWNVFFGTQKEAKVEKKTPTVVDGGYQHAWSARGKVVDGDGNPLPDVEISVHSGMGSLRRTGFAKTDEEGRYEVKFSRGVLMNIDSANLQVAQITAHLPGYVERNLSRHGNGAMAIRDVPEEDLKGWKINKESDFVLPGKPRQVDFVMVPATRIEGTLLGSGAFSGASPKAARKMDPSLPRGPYVDLDGSPLEGWRVWITGDELPPGSSVWDEATTDKDGKFVFENVPAGFEWHFETDTNIPDHKEPVSRTFTLGSGKENGPVSVVLQLKADQKQVEVEFLGANDKARAASEKPADEAAPVAKQTRRIIPQSYLDRFQAREWKEEYSDLPFGPAHENGLRVARFFEPGDESYAMGSQVSGRIVFHNSGTEPIEFTTEDWHQRDTWHCRTATGETFRPDIAERMGFRAYPTFRLGPGEVGEVVAQGTAIGRVPYDDEPGEVFVTSRLDLEPGETLTCSWDVTFHLKGAEKEETLRSGELTFSVLDRPADFPVDLGLSRGLGKYHLAEGIKLQCSQGSETTATIEWDDGRRHRISLEHRSRADPIELIAWQRGGTAFWIVETDQLRRIDFSDPDAVEESNWSWKDAPSDYGGASELVREAIHNQRTLTQTVSYEGKTLAEWNRILGSSGIRSEHREPLIALGYGTAEVPIPEEAVPMLLALVEFGEPATRCRCLGTLRKLEHPDDEVLDAVLKAVVDPRGGGNTFRAGYLLGRFPERAPYTVPRLIELLEKGGPGVLAVTTALGRIGPAASSALPILESLQSGADEKLSNAITEAIRAIREEEV